MPKQTTIKQKCFTILWKRTVFLQHLDANILWAKNCLQAALTGYQTLRSFRLKKVVFYGRKDEDKRSRLAGAKLQTQGKVCGAC